MIKLTATREITPYRWGLEARGSTFAEIARLSCRVMALRQFLSVDAATGRERGER